MIPIGHRPHQITIRNPGALVPDGEGGYTQAYTILASRIFAEIKPATARDLERVIANTVQASASHLVTLPFVGGVTTQSDVIFHDPVKGDRPFSIEGMHDPDERHIELVLACEEVVT